MNEVLGQIRRKGNPYLASLRGLPDAGWKCDPEDCVARSGFCGAWPARTAGHDEPETKRCCKSHGSLHDSSMLDRRATWRVGYLGTQCNADSTITAVMELAITPPGSTVARRHPASALSRSKAYSPCSARRSPSSARRSPCPHGGHRAAHEVLPDHEALVGCRDVGSRQPHSPRQGPLQR